MDDSGGAPRARAGPPWQQRLQRSWWQPAPDALARLLQPVSGLYAALTRLHRALSPAPRHAPVPCIVVGNLVVGGAGKTPVVIALVQALAAAGWHPGVISRGHGRLRRDVRPVAPDAHVDDVGDEPLLIHRRTGVPVWVGANRLASAAALCRAHPEVDVLVSDDGLQHHRLQPDAVLLVFDRRGTGNGLLLPAGPLRQPLPAAAPPHWQVLYAGLQEAPPLPGALLDRSITRAQPLAAWRAASREGVVPIEALQGRPLVALAGVGDPAQFFAALRARGLDIRPLAQPDHASYAGGVPWPEGTAEVVTTEKDAVKLTTQAAGSTAVWVVPLDCALPDATVARLLARLPPHR